MDQLVASATTVNLPQAVLRWKTMVEEECNAQGVPELVPYVLGIIMVESGGNSETTPDIMQSSESQGRPANSINNPKESIHYGVMHLKGSFADAKKYGITDLSAIVQTYNFGRAYIRWLANNNKQHSLPVADQYSKTVVAPSLGNTTGAMVKYSHPIAVAYNGGYRYKNGGNFFYAEIVKQYVDFNAGGVPQPEGIGFAKSIYWEGFGINYHDGPHGNYQGNFTTAAEVLYWDAYWGEDNDVWLDLGRSRWVKAEHYYWRPFKAISKYPEGYGVNFYDGINGSYKGRITSKEPLTVFFRKEGWIDIGGNSWAPEEHFDIVDIR
ncbi:lysozyme family protein [Bacillus wiedmannii]|uniref:Lysozyme n=2 Tax=Bacillus cereus group TaxID=86661 RepID=A0ABD6TMF2_9BACI|nr:lysozyme family protein [Bacillus wiedmannii]PEO58288.1 lysozyme [Bacillus wiedmannii]PGC75938.1 lysozyme [Bacillus wiedmannii]PHG19465.1 lysozyme [Bacillus wiedmannii]